MIAGPSHAVGLYVVGKEECNCSSLVARGIIPDTLNKLKEAFLIPQLAGVLDKLAIEVQALLANAGPTPASDLAAVKEETPFDKQTTEPEKVAPKEEEKPVVEKSAKEKKPVTHAKETKKAKKRVKIPPRAM